MLWSKSTKTENLFNLFENKTRELGKPCFMKKAQLYMRFLSCIYFLAFWVTFIFSQQYGSPLTTPQNVFQLRIREARERLFIFGQDNLTNFKPEYYSNVDVTLGLGFTWLQFVCEIVNVFSEVFLLAYFPITMWMAAKQFEATIKEGSQQSIEIAKIVTSYENLKQFCEELNSVASKLFLVWMVEMAFRTIFVFDEDNVGAWTMTDFVKLMFFLLNLLFLAMAMYLTADVFVTVIIMHNTFSM